MEKDDVIRKLLVPLLEGKGAHVPFDTAIEGFPFDLLGKRVEKIPHTMWHLVEHMRIAQWDILEFSRDPKHVSPGFPKGYWPEWDGPDTETAWKASLDGFYGDLDDMKALVSDPKSDLYTPFAHGDGQNLIREALVLADHNSYHLAQMVDLRMLLGIPAKDW